MISTAFLCALPPVLGHSMSAAIAASPETFFHAKWNPSSVPHMLWPLARMM